MPGRRGGLRRRCPRELDFDGIATVCVYAWEDRWYESSKFLFERVSKEMS